MRNKFAWVFVLASVLTFGSGIAFADSVSAEYRVGDLRTGTDVPDSREYKFVYTAQVAPGWKAEVESATKQLENQGRLSMKLSARAGVDLPALVGITPTVKAELGRSLSQGNNFNFWGYSVGVSHPLVGPVEVNAGFRYRREFQGAWDEYRYNAGVTYKFDEKNAFGVQYYLARGTTESSYAGLTYSRKL